MNRKMSKGQSGVMLKVALGGLLGDSLGWKEGRRDTKIWRIRKGNPHSPTRG